MNEHREVISQKLMDAYARMQAFGEIAAHINSNMRDLSFEITTLKASLMHKNNIDEFICDVLSAKWSSRTRNVLKAESIKTLKDLVLKSRYEISDVPNCGRLSMREIEEYLAKFDLSLGMTEVEYNRWLKEAAKYD